MSRHIAIVDDDPVTRTSLASYFEREGFAIHQAVSADELQRLLARLTIDLILLDIRLPGKDGLAITRELRAQSEVGIILVTGRADPIDRVIGLELGADDYIVKPFEPREILARANSLLRRMQTGAHPQGGLCRFQGWELLIDKRRLRAPDGAETRLTSSEMDLLIAFATHAGRILSRDELLDLTPRHRGDPFDRAIDTLVRRLRQVLETDPKAPTLIKTVHGAGYLFTADVERPPP